MKHISSVNNATIRQVEQLQRKSKARKKEGLFIVEGAREIMLCDQGGFILNKLIVSPEIIDLEEFNTTEVYDKLSFNQTPEVITVSVEVYEKIAYRSGTEGVIAIAQTATTTLDDLNLKKNPLILVTESIEKPGNLGALLRTADAAKVDAVILANPIVDLYNPNVIRSSVGCVFTVPVISATTDDTIEFLDRNNIRLYAATLQSSKQYDLIDYKLPTAIAVGTEATGLSQEIRAAATDNIIIPMSGKIDSMNVSVSAAILIFEAKRQRGF